MKQAETHHSGSLNKLAFLATIHCLAGCAIGEVAGMIIGTSLGWSTGSTIALSIVLAFISGYSLTMLPLKRSGMTLRTAFKVALAADTASIGIMEIVDNLIMFVIPGAMTSGVGTFLFWGSLLLSLVIAGIVAYPVNRWLISKGKGHSVAHSHHSGHHHSNEIETNMSSHHHH